MGLDTSHDCWHGPYSAFTHWRNVLAEAAGYSLVEAEDGYMQPDLDWDAFEWCNYQGMWQKEPEDALVVLLAHSDCDGYLFPHQHAPLIARLQELLPKIEDGYSIRKTQEFVDGLQAASSGEDVVIFH